MQVVDTAIISGSYSLREFSNPSNMFFWPPNTAASSVIESDTVAIGSRKWRLK